MDNRLEDLARREWQELVEKDDRTSPEEYPDMALITFDELREIISGSLLADSAAKDAEIAKVKAEARRVIEPFADGTEHFNDWCPDETPAWHDADENPVTLTVGDFRAARTFLQENPQ